MRATRLDVRRACRRRAASPGGRRRPPHPRSAVALPARRGLSRHHRRQRGGGARQARRPALRSPDPRRDDAGRDRLRFRPLAAHVLERADPDADRARRGREPHRGARDRRRRLSSASRSSRASCRCASPTSSSARARRRRRRSSRCASAISCSISARGELRRGEEVIHLTDRERDMLRVLAATPGETVPRAGARRQRRRRSASAPSTCRSTACAARSSAIPPIPLLIQTVRGIGYRLVTTP